MRLCQERNGKRSYLLDAAVCVVVFIFVGCFANSEAAEKQKEINIGLHVALSGKMAEQMQAGHDAVKMLVDQWNKKGGINGVPINLRVVDDVSTVEGAISAAERLITKDKVLLLNGGYSTQNEAVARVAERYKTRRWSQKVGQCDKL